MRLNAKRFLERKIGTVQLCYFYDSIETTTRTRPRPEALPQDRGASCDGYGRDPLLWETFNESSLSRLWIPNSQISSATLES